MFALEIGFKGDSPASETIFIRRPTALIGARQDAHVLIDDMASLGYCVLITRDVGRRFRLSPIGDAGSSYTPQFLEGVYDGEAVVDLGPIVLYLTALDTDLLPKESEAPDRAGVRVLRQSCSGPGPKYPAILLVSNPPATVSFIPEQPLMVGRSRQCSLRVDTPSISSRHARIGFESGEFWVEDLGSTNGTFVNKQQVSGRVSVAPGTPISLGQDVTLVGVLSADDASGALSAPAVKSAKATIHEKRYPLLLSVSETARPAQLMLTPGSAVVLGRDPSSDMWLGVPHVSRRHCSVEVSMNGVVRITDSSTNGTSYDGGVLRKDESTESSSKPLVLDFGGGVTVALCFSDDDEKKFINAHGAPQTFSLSTQVEGVVSSPSPSRKGRKKSKTTFLKAPHEVREAAAIAAGKNPIQRLFGTLSSKGRLALTGVTVVMLGLALGMAGLLILGWK